MKFPCKYHSRIDKNLIGKVYLVLIFLELLIKLFWQSKSLKLHSFLFIRIFWVNLIHFRWKFFMQPSTNHEIIVAIKCDWESWRWTSKISVTSSKSNWRIILHQFFNQNGNAKRRWKESMDWNLRRFLAWYRNHLNSENNNNNNNDKLTSEGIFFN